MTDAVKDAAKPEAPEKVRRRKSRVATVVRAKMTKTVVVVVQRRVKSPKYNKYVLQKKRFVAHDELGCKEGDRVRIRETRPMSKTKRWRVVEKLSAGHN